MVTTTRTLEERFRQLLPPGADRVAVAEATYAALAHHVLHTFACFATTDPASGVVTWASKTRSLGVGDEEFAASEYGPPDVNKFEDVARRSPAVAALSLDTGGHPETCRRHREFMAPRFGFTDELRAAFTSRGVCWAALGIYRGPGDPPFDARDVEQVSGLLDSVVVAVQRSLFGATTPPEDASADPDDRPAGDPTGPAVLIVGADDRALHQTLAATAAVEDLGGLDHGSLPASLLHVVATTRTRGAPFEARTQGRSGRWLALRAAPLAADGRPGREVVVSVEAVPRGELRRLALAAHGLTTREEEVALLVLRGADTREIAAALFLSPHTVQDHLKNVFAKLGVGSRREMVARLVLG
ncbi:LuxR C-terminal-related transcriptional regulator [Nocardioides korecus]